MRTCTLIFILSLAATRFAAADSFAYESTSGNNFGTIDLTTGHFTFIGNMGQLLSGLGETPDGKLYGGVVGTNMLYNVNPTTGGLTAIGTGNFSYEETASTLTTLYGVAFSGANSILFSIDPTTGQTTQIGLTGLDLNVGGNVWGMSTNSSTLYLSLNNNLYTLNTSTGAATLVGPMASSSSPISVGAMVQLDQLYAGQFTNTIRVDTLNPSTGAATFQAPLTGTADDFYGLAPIAVTPLPSSAWGGLALLGGLGFTTVLRRRWSAAA